MTDEERFWSKVDRQGPWDCWDWKAGRSTAGYGKFKMGRHPDELAHRWVWRFVVGPIPSDMQIDHLCRNRACVNPCHLELVTPAENVRRGEAGQLIAAACRQMTHCRRGHEYTPDNLIKRARGRQCRQCARLKARERERDRRALQPPRPTLRKTHCLRGHPLSGSNLYVSPKGLRQCRECARQRIQAFYARKKGA